jgi:hypothetical protein
LHAFLPHLLMVVWRAINLVWDASEKTIAVAFHIYYN